MVLLYFAEMLGSVVRNSDRMLCSVNLCLSDDYFSFHLGGMVTLLVAVNFVLAVEKFGWLPSRLGVLRLLGLSA